jgi:hypothetical protein
VGEGGGLTCLLEEEQATEEPDPDDVDEVPVVADPLHNGELTRIAPHVTSPFIRPRRKTMATRPRKTWSPWRPVMMKNNEPYELVYQRVLRKSHSVA